MCSITVDAVRASPMHCRSCSGSGFLTGSLHNGFHRRAGSSMAMASRVRSSVVLCQDEGGRRISYKRRQQLPPRKGLSPSIDSTDVFEAHKHLHPHKTRALEFLCDNEETTTSTTKDVEFRVVSDGTWSSRMLMQVSKAGWLWRVKRLVAFVKIASSH